MPDDAEHLIETWLRTKYTTRADPRQREMGLSYVTAETRDLAREIAVLLGSLSVVMAQNYGLAGLATEMDNLAAGMSERSDV